MALAYNMRIGRRDRQVGNQVPHLVRHLGRSEVPELDRQGAPGEPQHGRADVRVREVAKTAGADQDTPAAEPVRGVDIYLARALVEPAAVVFGFGHGAVISESVANIKGVLRTPA